MGNYLRVSVEGRLRMKTESYGNSVSLLMFGAETSLLEMSVDAQLSLIAYNELVSIEVKNTAE